MKTTLFIIGFILCAFAGGLATWYGGFGALVAVLIGETGAIIIAAHRRYPR